MLFDFEIEQDTLIALYCTIDNGHDLNGALLKLVDALSVPGYLVYDNASTMFTEMTNIDHAKIGPLILNFLNGNECDYLQYFETLVRSQGPRQFHPTLFSQIVQLVESKKQGLFLEYLPSPGGNQTFVAAVHDLQDDTSPQRWASLTDILNGHIHEMFLVFTSYILTKCIMSYVIFDLYKSKKPAITDTVAVHIVLTKLYNAISSQRGGTQEQEDGGATLSSLFDEIFSQANFERAVKCFNSMQNHLATRGDTITPDIIWWVNPLYTVEPLTQVDRVSRVSPMSPVSPVSPVLPTSEVQFMHPANFIIQRDFEMICGFIAIFTMLSKSPILEGFFIKSLEKQASSLGAQIIIYKKGIEDFEAHKGTTNLKIESIRAAINVKLNEFGAANAMSEDAQSNLERIKDYETLPLHLPKLFRHGLNIKMKKLEEIRNSAQAKVFEISAAVRTLTTGYKLIVDETNQLDKYISSTKTILVEASEALDKNRKYSQYMSVLFKMKYNLSGLTAATADVLSINFKSHRLLDQLQALFPETLRWSNHVSMRYLYTYALDLFKAAGVDARQMSIMTSKTSDKLDANGGKQYDCKHYINKTSENSDHLYVHVLCEDMPTYLCIPMETIESQTCANIYDTSVEADADARSFTLGGFVFSSQFKSGDTCNHAICGFRDDSNTHFVYNGYYDRDNKKLPCPPMHVPWGKLFSGQAYYLSGGDCLMKDTRTHTHNPSPGVRDMVFEYPFNGYFGFGIVSSSIVSTEEPTPRKRSPPPHDQLPPIEPDLKTVINLKNHLVEKYNTKLLGDILTILQKVVTPNSSELVEMLDEIYELLKPTRSLIAIHGGIIVIDKSYPNALLECIEFIVLNIRNWACEFAVLNTVYEFRAMDEVKRIAKQWFHDDSFCNLEWFIDIIIHVSIEIYAETQRHNVQVMPGTMSDLVPAERYGYGIDGIVNMVFNIVKSAYVPVSILNVLHKHGYNSVQVNAWVIKKICTVLTDHGISSTETCYPKDLNQLHEVGVGQSQTVGKTIENFVRLLVPPPAQSWGALLGQ
jgi:hypothetical protein